MHEDGGGAVPQSTISSKIATGVVLKPNSHTGQQEQRQQDARTSCDQPSGSKSSGETWNNAVDYWLMPWHTPFHSRTTGHKSQRQAKKMTEHFEKSQELTADMNKTEIFELCENPPMQQCPDCNLHWEVGFVYCTCGRCLKSWQRTKEVDKNNCDVSSVPGYVVKK